MWYQVPTNSFPESANLFVATSIQLLVTLAVSVTFAVQTILFRVIKKEKITVKNIERISIINLPKPAFYLKVNLVLQ